METRLNISNEYMVAHFIILFFYVLLLVRYSQTWEPALKPNKITSDGAQDDRTLSCSVTTCHFSLGHSTKTVENLLSAWASKSWR